MITPSIDGYGYISNPFPMCCLDKKPLLEYLIKHYTAVIKVINNRYFEFAELQHYLAEQKVQYGICFAAQHLCFTTIKNDSWIVDYNKKEWKGYWAAVPINCENAVDVRKVLLKRLNIMKKEYEKEQSGV